MRRRRAGAVFRYREKYRSTISPHWNLRWMPPLPPMIVEPVQGFAGARECSPEFLRAARRLCSEHGALLIFDEVQCGVGRCGAFTAAESFGVTPDLLTLAKGLAAGLPIGAVIATEDIAKSLSSGGPRQYVRRRTAAVCRGARQHWCHRGRTSHSERDRCRSLSNGGRTARQSTTGQWQRSAPRFAPGAPGGRGAAGAVRASDPHRYVHGSPGPASASAALVLAR